MNVKDWIVTTVKILALTAIMAVVYIVAGSVAATAVAAAANPDDAGAAIVGILVTSLVDVLVLAFVVRHSRWAGLPLIAGLAFSFYGVQTFIGQIEALAFLTPMAETLGSGSAPTIIMSQEMITGMMLTGILLALVVVPLTVLFFGKASGTAGETRPRLAPEMGVREWAWKLAAVIVVYELLYFGFGYYVAWQSSAVRAFYQGSDPGSFLAQMVNVVTHTPLLIPLQALRALLWVLFTLPLIMMVRDKGWVGALAVALMVSLPMNIGHVIPNPFMPEAVRLVHFVETATSNFILGLFLFWLLHRPHRSLGELFSRAAVAEVSV